MYTVGKKGAYFQNGGYRIGGCGSKDRPANRSLYGDLMMRRPQIVWGRHSFADVMATSPENVDENTVDSIIREHRLMASYNWDTDAWLPTIVVPGAPKIFHAWSGGILHVRDEPMMIDEESYRIPTAPMEPLFTALRLCQPNFKLSDVDLIADVNCLKKLLRFVVKVALENRDKQSDTNGNSESQPKGPERNLGAWRNGDEFRIEAQMLGGRTLVLMRREQENHGFAMGYGMGYLAACTNAFDDPTVAGPYKRITYVNIGGLRVLLRHKMLAAAYTPLSTESKGESEEANKNVIVTAPTALKNDGYKTKMSTSTLIGSTIRYVLGGYKGDLADLTAIEFASRSKLSDAPLVIDKWLDMVLIGSNHMYYGEHIHGRFDQPTMRSRAETLRATGLTPNDAQRILTVLQAVLTKIVNYARQNYAASSAACQKNADVAGDRDMRQKRPCREPADQNNSSASFAIISADGCSKLEIHNNVQPSSKGFNPRREGNPSFSCISESMLNALLAADKQDDAGDVTSK